MADIRVTITRRKELILDVNSAVLFNLTALIKIDFINIVIGAITNRRIIIYDILPPKQNQMTCITQ